MKVYCGLIRIFKNELEPLSLSRLKNEKWFLKGENSQKITLDAYFQLQKAYLDYSHEIEGVEINL